MAAKVAGATIFDDDSKKEELGCQKSHLSVAIHDVAPENWNEEVHDKVDASLVYSGEVYKAE